MSNYRITYLGKTGIFTEKDLQILRKRFARATGEISSSGWVERILPCICHFYTDRGCDKCPFNVWKDGCETIIWRLDPKKVMGFRVSRLHWHTKDQIEVNAVFRRIRGFLARAVRIPDGDSNA